MLTKCSGRAAVCVDLGLPAMESIRSVHEAFTTLSANGPVKSAFRERESQDRLLSKFQRIPLFDL